MTIEATPFCVNRVEIAMPSPLEKMLLDSSEVLLILIGGALMRPRVACSLSFDLSVEASLVGHHEVRGLISGNKVYQVRLQFG